MDRSIDRSICSDASIFRLARPDILLLYLILMSNRMTGRATGTTCHARDAPEHRRRAHDGVHLRYRAVTWCAPHAHRHPAGDRHLRYHSIGTSITIVASLCSAVTACMRHVGFRVWGLESGCRLCHAGHAHQTQHGSSPWCNAPGRGVVSGLGCRGEGVGCRR